MVLVPALYLLASGGSARHGFEVAAGGPATTTAPKPTGLAPDRIATDTPRADPAPTTATTAAPRGSEAAAPAAPPTSVGEAHEPEADEAVDEAVGEVDEWAEEEGLDTPVTTVATTEPSAQTTTPATAPPETTTTTEAPAPEPTTSSAIAPASVSKAATNTDRGKATWFNAPDNSCAHRTIPTGTIITVRRVSTGATTTCYVDQWGPAEMSVVIDLSMDTFEKLAPADVGVIEVVIEW